MKWYCDARTIWRRDITTQAVFPQGFLTNMWFDVDVLPQFSFNGKRLSEMCIDVKLGNFDLKIFV